MTGEPVCMSPGKTDNDFNTGIDCGTVRVGSISWLGLYDYIIRGADADNISTREGDSGSLMFTNNGCCPWALGIHNTAEGYFAKMGDALAATGATIHK